MGQVMRITVGNADYTFQVLNTKPLSTEDQEIRILLNGETTTIIKEKQGWRPTADTSIEWQEVAAAIGKMLSLRYVFKG